MTTLRPNVLLVDDQPANLLAMEVALSSLRVNLVCAQSGQQALAQLQQDDFAAVLLDVRMPGMGGFQVARAIRALPRAQSTPILFITAGDDSPQAIAEGYSLGAVDFLSKPLIPAVIKAKVGVFVDLYRSKEELRAGHDERIRLATEASGLAVWVWDSDSEGIIFEQEHVYEMLGLDPAQPLSVRRFEEQLLHPGDRTAWHHAAEATLRDGAPLFFEGRVFRASDRGLRWVEIRGRLQPARRGQTPQLIGTVGDITPRKQVEQRLLASEERYRTLFESIDEGFCLVQMIRDAEGVPCDYRFLEANKAFLKHTGLHEAVGRTMREIVPDHDAHWFEIYGRVADTREPVRFVGEAKAMDRWFDVYATPVNAAASQDCVAILFSDITSRRKAEEDLQHFASQLAQVDRAKTAFLATLAHELRNPLAPLANGLQLMRLGAADTSLVERTRQMMERQVHHLVRLVDDLLDLARISTGKIELRRQRIDLKDVVASAVELSSPLIETARHELSVSLPPQALPLYADPTRLGQVVANLLNNAAKYTPDGGAIRLDVQTQGDEVVLSVHDNGMGITPESLKAVFEMFTQMHTGHAWGKGGLGIGLSLVQRLVQMHGGAVAAESAGPGHGSTFTVRLPLAYAEPAELTPIATRPALSHKASLRVLVVDDNVDAAESLAYLLQMEGHATRVAPNGRQALAMAESFKPDAMFLDIGLPDLSGYELARQLRAMPHAAQAMLVALTGWGAQDDRARAQDAGFDHHLTKPAEIKEVMRLMQELQRTHESETGYGGRQPPYAPGFASPG